MLRNSRVYHRNTLEINVTDFQGIVTICYGFPGYSYGCVTVPVVSRSFCKTHADHTQAQKRMNQIARSLCRLRNPWHHTPDSTTTRTHADANTGFRDTTHTHAQPTHRIPTHTHAQPTHNPNTHAQPTHTAHANTRRRTATSDYPPQPPTRQNKLTIIRSPSSIPKQTIRISRFTKGLGWTGRVDSISRISDLRFLMNLESQSVRSQG